MAYLPDPVEVRGSVTAFHGYNLRGLIVAYLESRGWIWHGGDKEWWHETAVFQGEDATDRAIQHQIELEEGRMEAKV
jgi:hypothetical protein